MNELLNKQLAVMEALVLFSKKLLELLEQHTEVSKYEDELNDIMGA